MEGGGASVMEAGSALGGGGTFSVQRENGRGQRRRHAGEAFEEDTETPTFSVVPLN